MKHFHILLIISSALALFSCKPAQSKYDFSKVQMTSLDANSPSNEVIRSAVNSKDIIILPSTLTDTIKK